MCAPTSKSCLTSTIAEATSSSLNHRFQHIASGATTSNYAYHDDVQDDDQMSTIQSLAGAAAAVLVAVDRHWHGLFPARLYNMLSDAGPSNFGHVVSWACHGRCFRVHRPKEFVEQVMPRYFHQAKMASFQRQLNLYGFHRVPYGQDRGSYYHECFLQGRPSLALRITPVKVPRTRIKRTGKILVEKEPNFYALPPVNVLGLPRSREEADQLSRECNGLSDDRSDDNPSLDDIVTELFFEDDGVDIDMVQDFCSDWMPRNKQPVDWNG